MEWILALSLIHIFCRIFDGTVRKGQQILMMATGAKAEVVEVGIFGAGQFIPSDELSAGMVGYITASLKNVQDTSCLLYTSRCV